MGEARQGWMPLPRRWSKAIWRQPLTSTLLMPLWSHPTRGRSGSRADQGVPQGLDRSLPGNSYKLACAHESGDTAIDEGYFFGTCTAPLPLPTGENIPATGKQVRVRTRDVATVQDGVITSHRFCLDQMGFLGQLGLGPPSSGYPQRTKRRCLVPVPADRVPSVFRRCTKHGVQPGPKRRVGFWEQVAVAVEYKAHRDVASSGRDLLR